MKTARAFVIGGAMLAFVALEAGLRLMGAMSFPLYVVDDALGYIPAPNQSGAFLNRNDWIFNERSMEAEPYTPKGKPALLLLGDSIVYGGNPYRQEQKLGPQLEKALHGTMRVWPVGAGSWAVLNEMAYLERNRDLLSNVERLVWVVNSGDFAERSRWDSELIHPTYRPWFASAYLFRRYVGWRLWPWRVTKENPSPASVDAEMPQFERFLVALVAEHPRLATMVVLYPERREEAAGGGVEFDLVKRELIVICKEAPAGFLDVSADPRWSTAFYWGDPLHPTVEGVRQLASIIASGSSGARVNR